MNDDPDLTDPADGVGRAHPVYREWDAAYVLGALSLQERHEYEQHLSECRWCREAVAELAGIPGLLARIDPADAQRVSAGDRPVADGTAGPPADLVARITAADARHRTRRLRRRLAVGVLAAVLVAGAVLVPVLLSRDPAPTVATTLDRTAENPLSADVALFAEDHGTRITVLCTYASSGGWARPQPAGAWTYGLYVVDEAGTATLVSSWTARRGDTVTASGTVALDVAAIRSVQLRSIDTGRTLLTSTLR